MQLHPASLFRPVAMVAAMLLLLLGLFAVINHYLLQTYGAPPGAVDPFLDHLDEYAANPGIEFGHLAPSFVFFLLAPLQFISAIRRNWPRVHRIIGRVYVGAAVLSGLFGIAIGVLFPFGGGWETVIILPFGIYTVGAICWAFVLARRKQFARHRQWMIRGLAAALAISVQRIAFGYFAFGGPIDDVNLAFNLAMVVGGITTIGLAEIYVRLAPAPASGR